MYYFQNKIIEKLANFVFPSNTYCISCGKFIDNAAIYSVCDYCRERIDFGHIRIDTDKLKTSLGIELFLDSIWSSCYYGTFSRVMLQSLKDNEKKYIARTISEIIWERIATDEEKYMILDCDAIVPVPMSLDSERSFNQAEAMARFLSLKADIPTMDILVKSQGGGAQRKSSKYDRIVNIRGKISFRDYEKQTLEGVTFENSQIKGKSIVLLDDVFTTGATMNECARVLKSGGASKVHGLTFATGNKLAYGFFGIKTEIAK